MATVHDWVRRDYARYWGMQGLDRAGVTAAYREIVAPAHVRALIGSFAGAPAFLTELYSPIEEAFAGLYDARPSDRGLHILLAPPPLETERIPGFSRAAFKTVLDLLFADPAVERIVVEPDQRNHKIRAINRAFGFREIGPIDLPATPTAPGKVAMLSFCTREDLSRALARASEHEPR
nr:GNAT family N-acetyltransferase [Pseudenhygromyxa sp. WMMC2535]